MPGRIMVLLVCLGAVLSFLGIYDPFVEFAGAGASVPLLGFGHVLMNGVKEAIGEDGIMGLFTGGFRAGAAGCSAALIFGYLASLIFKPKMKNKTGRQLHMIKERLGKLREVMKQEGVQCLVIPTSDYHNSEYVSEYFMARKYFSGFTGSAGTLVVAEDQAALFTDGRYFIQAARELAGSDITLMKMGEPGVPAVKDYIKEILKKGRSLALTAEWSQPEREKRTKSWQRLQKDGSCMTEISAAWHGKEERSSPLPLYISFLKPIAESPARASLQDFVKK